ncbi:MAG TPA: creatininase family protein, partial [Candidatus Polarisedimenticolia bacterium]|nr:creatininase family protein [Candidatus Polarisedimenticolia bacterium]
FPGCVGITHETAASLVADVCRSALGQGFRAVCLVNSHLEPDHLASLREAATLVAAQTGRPIIFPDKTQPRWAASLTAEFRSGACHAGQYETSLVMAAEPESVREAIRLGLPPNPTSIGKKIKEGVKSFTEAGGVQAYFGDPRGATPEEGEASYTALAAMIETAVLEALA